MNIKFKIKREGELIGYFQPTLRGKGFPVITEAGTIGLNSIKETLTWHPSTNFPDCNGKEMFEGDRIRVWWVIPGYGFVESNGVIGYANENEGQIRSAAFSITLDKPVEIEWESEDLPFDGKYRATHFEIMHADPTSNHGYELEDSI